MNALPSPAARTMWDSLTERTADLGVCWTNCSNCGTEYDVPERIVKALADARVALRISVYATSEAIETACRGAERRVEHGHLTLGDPKTTAHEQ